MVTLTIDLVQKSAFPPWVAADRKWDLHRDVYAYELEIGHNLAHFDGVGEFHFNLRAGTLTVVVVPAERGLEFEPSADARVARNGRTFEFSPPHDETLLRVTNASARRYLVIHAHAEPDQPAGVGAKIHPRPPSLRASAMRSPSREGSLD